MEDVWREDMCIQGFSEKLDDRKPLGRPRRRCVGNILMDRREVVWDMDWLDLAQDRDR